MQEVGGSIPPGSTKFPLHQVSRHFGAGKPPALNGFDLRFYLHLQI
jgi:hypothetical protein